MTDTEYLAERFEEHRAHLRAVAYRMLGSRTEADDALQETWLRLSRDDRSDVENLGGWLTTVTARVCLNMLRSRETRREELVPEPIVSRGGEADPADEALLADAVGIALLVVLQQLGPAERLAFVLHDMFAVPFDEIAPIVDRSPEAARQLASRARRRVRGAAPEPDPDLERQREVVRAFLAAAREGDFDGLVAVLDPDVVLRAGGTQLTGAATVAGQAMRYRDPTATHELVLVNGAVGVLSQGEGRPDALLAFTVAGGRVAAIDVLAPATAQP